MDTIKDQHLELDAARYRRLRVLGCAVFGTENLKKGFVSRFTNLDEVVDADMEAQKSRGEGTSSTTPKTLTTPASDE